MIDYSITHAQPRFTVYEEAFVIDPILIIESSIADAIDRFFEGVVLMIISIGIVILLSLFIVVILFDITTSFMSPRGYL